jgi:putative ABC transport system permease protein
MIKNYLKIAFRSFYKNKMSSVINLSGLSIAIGCAIVMFLFIDLQLNIDRFHEHAEEIYLVETVIQSGDQEQTWATAGTRFSPGRARGENCPGKRGNPLWRHDF